MIYAFVLLAANASSGPSASDTSLLVAILAFAGTLAVAVGGVIQVLLTRAHREAKEKVQETKESNIEQRFTGIDSTTENLYRRLAQLDNENVILRERIATLEGMTNQQKEELRTRNTKIDELTRELAIWQYRMEQASKDRGGEGGSQH